MKRENIEIFAFVTIVILVIAVIFSFAIRKDDVTHCRGIFKGLVAGSQSVQKYIDWKKLKALDISVGSTYNGLSNDKQRMFYRKEFVRGFSVGFKSTGSRFKDFTNWRLFERGGLNAVIAADFKSRILLLTISTGSKTRKLTAIAWGTGNEQAK